MKKSLIYGIASLAMLAGATACSDSKDDPKDVAGTPQVNDLHFDIFVTLDGAGGMNSQSSILVLSVNSLEDKDAVYDFVNAGTDITASLYEESITKGEYYYMIPRSKDCFGKYQITPEGVKTIQERPFAKNTFKDRRYCHAWTGDNTLVILGSNGDNGSKSDKGEILWTKYDTRNLSIIGEGDLGLNGFKGKDGKEVVYFSTSGLARYRASDNVIVYAFQDKSDETSFYVAFIDADTMKVKNIVNEDRAEFMAGTAYGELLQNKMMVDENDNIYIACNSEMADAESYTCQYGSLLRINNGQYDFDKSFNAYSGHEGKLVTIDYLGSGKCLCYIQDPKYCGLVASNTEKAGWGSNYNCYYAVLDMASNSLEPVKCNGVNLPYCLGTFAQRSLVVNNKAYIGVNPEHSAPCIYVMDLNTWEVTKGSTIADGYTFDMIRYLGSDK